MKKKKICWLILAISVLFSSLACPSRAMAEHPAQEIMKFYEGDLEGRAFVDPYRVSILALNEVEQGRHLPEVKRFIVWYFSKLNYPDRHGLTGSMYNYVIENGTEKPTGEYDSVDGYAGLFLHLLHRYAVKTGDSELLQQEWKRIEDIAYLLARLQDQDGLTRALPDTGVKYLMDNCEAFGGISAYLALQRLAKKPESAYYRDVRDGIRKGILNHLRQDTTPFFSWAIENGKKSESAWKRFYPDAYAQLFPIYYEVLADTPERKALWRMFVSRHARKAKTFPIEQRIMFELTKKKMEGK